MSLFNSLVFSAKSGFILSFLSIFLFAQTEATAGAPLALYNFNAGGGSKVYDVSGKGKPLNLKIRDMRKVRWIPGGGLRVNKPTLIATSGPASKITRAIKASNAFTVEAWIKPASKKQGGPARIVTLSAGTGKRNVTLGQTRSTYDMYLRTTRTGINGNRSLRSKKGTLKAAFTHVVYTRSSNGINKLYINGVLRSKGQRQGKLGKWDTGYRFALANELTGNRPWKGSFYQVAIYGHALGSPEIKRNFSSGLRPAANGKGGSNRTASPKKPAPATSTSSVSTNTKIKSSIRSSGTGTIQFNWNAPSIRSNGEALAMNEIAGYTIYYGKTAGSYPNSIFVNSPYLTTRTLSNLSVGTYYIVVTVRDTEGRESVRSAILKKRTL